MRQNSRLFLLAIAASTPLFLTGCGTQMAGPSGTYHVTAHRPHDPSQVRVKVSLSQQNIYVMEGDRCLMAAATTVGIPSKPTPKGNFTIYSKQENKRSGSYGFRVQGEHIIPPKPAGHSRKLCRLSDGILV